MCYWQKCKNWKPFGEKVCLRYLSMICPNSYDGRDSALKKTEGRNKKKKWFNHKTQYLVKKTSRYSHYVQTDDVCKEIFTMSLTIYKFFTLAFFAESMINVVYLHVILDFLNFASTFSATKRLSLLSTHKPHIFPWTL